MRVRAYSNMSHRTRTAQFAHQAYKPPIAHTAERTAPPSALPSQQHCMRTFCPTRAAAVAPGWHLHCHATSMLCSRALTSTHSDRRTGGRAAQRRRPTHAPRCPPVPRAHCREPWPLAAPAAPCCRALTPAHCPRCPLPAAPVPPARATAAKMKVLAATTAAAETWFAHGTASARDMQGTRDTRHARGRPRMHGRRSPQRGAAPAGHNADRVDVDALDLVGDVGSRFAPAGLEEDVEGHLRSAPCEQAASRAADRRSRVSGRRVQTARVRGGGWGTVGDNAAQAAAGHSQTHQTTWYGRMELQTAKNDSSSIVLATNSTGRPDAPVSRRAKVPCFAAHCARAKISGDKSV
jgi:hypothetical protein